MPTPRLFGCGEGRCLAKFSVRSFFAIAPFAVLVTLTWDLISEIRQPTVYGLVIGTTSGTHEADLGMAKSEIIPLISEITEAVGKSHVAQTTTNVIQAVQGDYIQQYGDGNIGTATHRGSGDNVAGG